MNRMQQIRCVGICKLRVSSSINLSHALCPIFSHQRGAEFSTESLVAGSPPFWVSVLLLWSQSVLCSISCLSRVSLKSHLFFSQGFCFLISMGSQYPSYPFALAVLGTPFLQGVLQSPLSLLPLQIPIVTRRPQLIPVSTGLIPQTWPVCPLLFSHFHFPMYWLFMSYHMCTSGTALCAGDTRMKGTEPYLRRAHSVAGGELSRGVEDKLGQCDMICARKKCRHW